MTHWVNWRSEQSASEQESGKNQCYPSLFFLVLIDNTRIERWKEMESTSSEWSPYFIPSSGVRIILHSAHLLAQKNGEQPGTGHRLENRLRNGGEWQSRSHDRHSFSMSFRCLFCFCPIIESLLWWNTCFCQLIGLDTLFGELKVVSCAICCLSCTHASAPIFF